MKYFLCILFFCGVFLQAQQHRKVSIIDDHVKDYENTSFLVCFDANGDLKSMDYVPYWSSLERHDLKGVLESFYMSSKFQNSELLANKCLLTSYIQVNSKYENATAASTDCRNFTEGTFIYGKTNPVATIIRRNPNQQQEMFDDGMLTAELEWPEDCRFLMKNPVFENPALSCPECKIDTRIIGVEGNKSFMTALMGNEKHYLEIIKVNSLKFNAEKSHLFWTGSAGSVENSGIIKIKDAVLETENGEIKYLNAFFDISSVMISELKSDLAQGLKEHLLSEEFFNAERYPYAGFRLLTSKRDKNRVEITGILTVKSIPQPISFTGTIQENRNKFVLKSDKITVSRSAYKIAEGSEMLKDEMEISFQIEFEK